MTTKFHQLTNLQDWRGLREQAQKDPGAFHGEIARRELFWYEPDRDAWIKRVEDIPGGWAAFGARTGEPLTDLRLAEDFVPWKRAFDDSQAPFYRWFAGGLTNCGFNEVDAHVLAGFGSETAFIVEGEQWDPALNGGKGGPTVEFRVSRRELLLEVTRHAMILKSLGLKCGDRITLNMPSIISQIYFIEAAKRLGIIYTSVFGGFSAKTLAERVCDAESRLVITTDGSLRNGQVIRSKELYADRALEDYVPAARAEEKLRDLIRSVGMHQGASLRLQAEFHSVVGDELVLHRDEIGDLLKTACGRAQLSDRESQEVLNGVALLSRDGFPGFLGVVVVRHLGLSGLAWSPGRDRWCNELMDQANRTLVSRALELGFFKGGETDSSLPQLSDLHLFQLANAVVPVEKVDSNFPLFIAFTSGSTGKPKGIVHTHGGYASGLAHTMRIAFGVEPGDGKIIYTVADPGWITGQSYLICAPLITRTTSVVTEGSPIFPNAGRFTSTIERHRVTIFKAGSTFLKAVMADPQNQADMKRYDRSSLQVATFCAEPTSPAVQQFGMENVTPRYINSYWASEHGGMVLTHFAGSSDFKLAPDAHTFALPWIMADVWIGEKPVDVGGRDRFEPRPAKVGEKGEIVITRPYPYLTQTLWGDASNFGTQGWKGDFKRYVETYWDRWAVKGSKGEKVEWAYTQGDFACKYEDGSFTLHGRSDEVINTLGHRIGTEEIEGAILKDKRMTPNSPVGNAIVVGAPHPEKGTVPLAFVLVISGRTLGPEDEKRLSNWVKEEKGEVAAPAAFIPVSQFPETRSGKYMRRYLKAMLEGEPLGDTSTLRNPESLKEIQECISAWKIRVAAQAKLVAEAGGEGELLARLEKADPRSKRKALTTFLTEELAVILSGDSSRTISAEGIDLKQPLRDQGLDSLKALQFSNRLKRSLGKEKGDAVSITTIFNYPTLEAISDYLAREVLGLEATKNRRTGQQRRAQDDPIAIIGMACRFPGGVSSPEEFWKLLSEGRDAVTELPAGRWRADEIFNEDMDAPGTIYCTRGGFLEHTDRFDAEFFGISAREAAALDPQHRLLLETSWEAFERAQIHPDQLMGSQTGVFVGITTREYYELMLNAQDRDELEVYMATGTSLNTAAGRISYTFGLQGPAMSIDTACSSSLVGVHLACQSLRTGESDLALAAGVNLMVTPSFSISLSRTHALSPDGLCKTFDEHANGYVRSEGCGVVVLKRYSKALADGDRILALIRGTAVNQDGRSSSLTAPNGLAQEALVREALGRAQVKPGQVGYVEAHGTGTPLGDPIEVQALGRVYGEGRERSNPLTLGSVKTNIGHCESAAGVAGLIKAVLALRHQKIPAHLHFKKLNPHISIDQIPARIPTALEPWEPIEGRRIAGVSSFGFSGTNAHALVEEAPKAAAPDQTVSSKGGERPKHVLLLSAKSEDALRAFSKKYADLLTGSPGISAADLCFSANQFKADFDFRCAIIGSTTAELKEKLASVSEGKDTLGVVTGRAQSDTPVAFLFTGQGAQYPGMGKSLYESHPLFREALDRCDQILQPFLKQSIKAIIFGTASPAAAVNRTEFTQPALFVFEYALYQLWRSWGLVPSAVMGHSVGELVAACVAGVFSLEDGLKLIFHRSRLMQSLPGHGEMAAVSMDEEKVAALLEPFKGRVSIAGLNGPGQTVISGESKELRAALTRFEQLGCRIKVLTVSHAFHSPQMDPILDEFEKIAAEVRYSAPALLVLSNLTGKKAEGQDLCNARYWRNHLRQAVRFSDGLKVILSEGIRHFVEIGPGGTLLGMAGLSLPEGMQAYWYPSNKKDRDDWEQLLESFGGLYTQGAKLNREGLDLGFEARKKIELPTYPFQRKRYWMAEGAPGTVAAGKAKRGAVHPFFESKVRSATHENEIVYQTLLYSNRPAGFLNDHRVFDHVVVPAVSYVDFILWVMTEDLGVKAPVVIERFAVDKPLLPKKDKATVLQVVFTQDGAEHDYSVQIYSRTDEESPWVAHASARVRARAETDQAVMNDGGGLQELRQRCTEEQDVGHLYESIFKGGLELHSRFHGMQKVWVGKNEILAQVKLVPALEDEYPLFAFHPSHLDSCQQVTITWSIMNSQPGKPRCFIVLATDKMVFHRSPPKEVWVHAILRAGGGLQDKTMNADIRILDASGEVVFEHHGLTLIEAPKEALMRMISTQESTGEWFYEPKWKEIPPVAPEKPSGKWLIFGDFGGLGDALAGKVRSQGGMAVVIPLEEGRELDFAKAIEEHKEGLARVVHLMGLQSNQAAGVPKDLELASADQIEKAQQTSYLSVLQLTQSLLRAKGLGEVRLAIVTRGARASGSPGEKIDPTQTPVWGFGQSLVLEHPELQCLRIDLDLEPAPADAATLYDQLQANDGEEQILLRGGKRFGARLARATTVPKEMAVDSIKGDATYLITGAFGGLGVQVARWMAQRGAKSLVLVGRNEPNEASLLAIAEIEKTGAKVMVSTTDIANEDDVRRLFSKITNEMPPLKGIIHAAGKLSDGGILQQDWEKFRSASSPKIKGTWNLHKFTRNLKLDFFVMFSSATSLIGNRGQANYAAANEFMDEFAKYRRYQGLHGLSINWGPWAEVGMASHAERTRQQLAEIGFEEIPVTDGLRALGNLMTCDRPQVAVLK